MQIYAQPKVVSGTNKGGEDLFINFAGSTDERPDLKEIPFNVLICLTCGNGVVNEVLHDDGHDIKAVKWTTSAYQFEWEGTNDQLAGIVLPYLKDPENWTTTLDAQAGAWKFSYDHFVNGNAD